MIIPEWISLPILGLSVLGLVVSVVAWARAHFGASSDFDEVNEWSLSVEIGCMASSHEGGMMHRYIRDMCRFVNLSTTQARVVEMTMTIPYLDKEKPPVSLYATRRLPIKEVRIGPVLAARYDPFLSFPIRIEPNGVVEGRIEFEVQEGGIASDDLDLFRARATIRESRSHQFRHACEGEVYDALQQRSYRGRIGDPHPVWGPRLRRWKRRLSGRPSLRLGTVGQMVENATSRMEEIEQELAAEKIAHEASEAVKADRLAVFANEKMAEAATTIAENAKDEKRTRARARMRRIAAGEE